MKLSERLREEARNLANRDEAIRAMSKAADALETAEKALGRAQGRFEATGDPYGAADARQALAKIRETRNGG